MGPQHVTNGRILNTIPINFTTGKVVTTKKNHSVFYFDSVRYFSNAQSKPITQNNHITFYSSRTGKAYNRCKWPVAIKYFCTKYGGDPTTASRHWCSTETMDTPTPPRPKNILNLRLQGTRKYCALTFSLML